MFEAILDPFHRSAADPRGHPDQYDKGDTLLL